MVTRAAEQLIPSLPRPSAVAWLLVIGCGADDGALGERESVSIEGCPGVAGETVRWIVPFSPGGGYDVYSRLLEPFYEEAIGAQIVIENRAGAGDRVGARAIRDAEPDGRTLGVLNAYSLLVMELSEGLSGLHLVNDFTVLGRISTANPVWVTNPGSPYRSVEDLLVRAGDEPILVGLLDVGGTGFTSVSVAAELLGPDVAYLTGYPGSRESSLGLIRGEFDLAGQTFDSLRDRIEAGDLIPILQISASGNSDHPALRGIPHLAGPNGLAARSARERGMDPELAIARATALSRIFEAGRLVVAPPGLPPSLGSCLSSRLEEAVSDSAFVSAASRAQRPLAFERPAIIAAELLATQSQRRSLAPVLRRHAEIARGVANAR